MFSARRSSAREVLTGVSAAVIRCSTPGRAGCSVVVCLPGDVAVTATRRVYGTIGAVGRVCGSASPRILVGAAGVIVAIRSVATIARCRSIRSVISGGTVTAVAVVAIGTVTAVPGRIAIVGMPAVNHASSMPTN